MRADPGSLIVEVRYTTSLAENPDRFLANVLRRVLDTHKVRLGHQGSGGETSFESIVWIEANGCHTATVPLLFSCDPDDYVEELNCGFAHLTNPCIDVRTLAAQKV